MVRRHSCWNEQFSFEPPILGPLALEQPVPELLALEQQLLGFLASERQLLVFLAYTQAWRAAVRLI